MGKGEIAHYEQFLLFPVFSKGLFCRHVKTRACLGKLTCKTQRKSLIKLNKSNPTNTKITRHVILRPLLQSFASNKWRNISNFLANTTFALHILLLHKHDLLVLLVNSHDECRMLEISIVFYENILEIMNPSVKSQ